MTSIAVRSPLESFFAANSKEDQRLILQSGLNFVKKELDTNGVHFAYQLGAEKKELATTLGISLHPVPFLSHSHPFCKIIENHMLLNVLPELMGNGKWIFTSIKKKKIDSVIKKGGKSSCNIDFVNKVICAKDFSRYDFEPKFHEHRVNTSSRDFIFPKVYMKSCHHNKIFIHDEVHHWSINDMIFFLNDVEPTMLAFTVVYPPELLKGILQPQNKRLYDFIVDKSNKKLFFFPDGCRSEGYEQPERLDWLFEAAYIDTGRRLYTVKLIKSAYAHHMFQIVPGEYRTDSKRFFGDFNTINLSVIHENRFMYYDYIPIKKIHVQKVYSYLMCLKKPDVESGLAKLRQMFDDEQDCRVVEFFSRFCNDIIKKHKGSWDLYGHRWIDDAKLYFLDLMPKPLAKMFNMWEGKNLFDFLFQLESLVITVDTKVVSKTFSERFYSDISSTSMFSNAMPECIDNLWFGNGITKSEKWAIRVMSDHNAYKIIDGARAKMSILNYLHQKIVNDEEVRRIERLRRRSMAFNGFFQIEWTNSGPFNLHPSVIKRMEEEKLESFLLKNRLKSASYIRAQKRKEEKIFLSKCLSFLKLNFQLEEAEIMSLIGDGFLMIKARLNFFGVWCRVFNSDEFVNLILVTCADKLAKTDEFIGIDFEILPICDDDFCYDEPLQNEFNLDASYQTLNSTTEERKEKESKGCERGGKGEKEENADNIHSKQRDESSIEGRIESRSILSLKDLESSCFISIPGNEEVKKDGNMKRIVKIVGDGNCFFRAISYLFYGCESRFAELREEFAYKMEVNEAFLFPKEAIDLARAIGRYTEDFLTKAFINVYDFELKVYHDTGLTNYVSYTPKLKGAIKNDWLSFSLILIDEHFDAVVNVEKKQSDQGINSDQRNVNECGTEATDNKFPIKIQKDSFEELEKLQLSDLKFTQLKNRKAFFLTSNPDVDYSHNGINYKVNLYDVEELCPKHLRAGFNACLIQIFNEGGSIGFHKDDEICYDNHVILSINLMGSATFMIKGHDEQMQIKLTDGDYLFIDEKFQSKYKHAVSDCTSGRINVTFRKHLRAMDKSPIMNFDSVLSELKNKCLIDAIAKNERKGENCIIRALLKADKMYWMDWVNSANGSTMNDLIKASEDLKFSFEIDNNGKFFRYGNKGPCFQFKFSNEHFEFVKLEKIGKIMTELDRRCNEDPKKNSNSNFNEQIVNVIECSAGYNRFDYSADPNYVLKLVDSFNKRTTGVNLSEIYSNGKSIFSNAVKEAEKERKIIKSIHSIIGFGGSGKSRILQTFIKKRRSESFLIISPRNNLMSDWLEKAKCKHSNVKTFEVAMRVNFKKISTIIIDELTLFPNGYLDTLIYLIGSEGILKKEIICIFDPLQSRYHSELDELCLGQTHDVDRMLRGEKIQYLLQSHRLNSSFFLRSFKGIMVNKQLKDEGDFTLRIYDCHLRAQIVESAANRNLDVMLVGSRDEKRALSGKLNVMTFGEAQGLTFNRVIIVLSEHTRKQDEYRWMVALTRARLSICFLNLYLGGADAFIQACGNKIINCFLRGEEITERRLKMMCVADEVNMVKDAFGGKQDEVDREDRLEGDLFIKPFIFLGQRINSEEPILVEAEVVEPKGKTHLCHAQENFAQSINFDKIRAKELREFRIKDTCTNQFCESYEKVGNSASIHTTGPMRFEAIYPRHRADDDLTFWMAVHKRLRFSDEAKERAKLKEASGIGQLLYYNLKQKMNFSFSADPQLLEKCLNDFETKKLLKNKATIANHAIRSDKDWPMNQIFLFMKSQLCTKFEKQYVDAKAGQTLACFQHMILVKFAPYCRYMEAMIRKQLPDEIYIHSNKNFDDLDAWTKKFYKRDICVESDYEAFDASQDEFIVSFEVALMEDMGLPNSFINDYIDLKCTLGCKLGHFAIMRFTGEFCTFLFNTLANMAFTMCRYNWESGQPIAFAGDDMCALNNLEVSDKFDEIFEKLSLQAKVVRTENPMFCGWRLSQYGIVKEPELVYNRFMVAKERGNVSECLENYAIEVSYAYSLGERLFEVLKREDQIEYHQSVIRFIVKRLDKLKTKVKDLFSDQEDV